MARIISIANQKGGVGKTTTAVNLSASLAFRGKKILLIDCDPQGSAASALGLGNQSEAATIYDVIINGVNARAAVQQSEYGVELIPANIDLAGAEVELATMPEREFKMRAALEPLHDEYDFILIDCPPSLGLLTLNSLNASDSIIIPIQCEFYALEGVTQLLHTIELVKSNFNPLLAIDGVLLTMYDARTRLSQQVVDEVKKNFGYLVYETLIPRNVRLSEAPSFGMPVIAYDRRSRGTQVYLNLADEILKSNQQR